MAELYGINTEGASVEEEVLERDLEKFLESARLSKYMQACPKTGKRQDAAGHAFCKPTSIARIQQAALDWPKPKFLLCPHCCSIRIVSRCR
ncbi:unnamed protein product [Symbiodinium necroappetens]|uniref:Uncharacterized protein n=1 Tax=Symbiodinium necroappetens TaxID=1628268 RepID=A0A812XT69_9DINO|nr:unnamed protein product [Symbiodinium necroappetens]